MILEEYLRIRTLSDGSTEEEITYPENFNFGWDVVSRIASRTPEKRALVSDIRGAPQNRRSDDSDDEHAHP